MRERARRPLAHHQMRLHSRPMQHLQQAHTKDRSRGPRDADDEASGFCQLHCGLIFYECEARRKEGSRSSARYSTGFSAHPLHVRDLVSQLC